MGNLSEDTIRKTLNAYAVACGSKPLSTTPAFLTATPTAYTGGMTLKNADAAITIWYRLDGVAAAIAGTGCDALTAGERIPIAWGDTGSISAVAASGTPTISWVGTTL